MKVFYIFLVFLLLDSRLSEGQKLTFDYLTIKDGLPQNTVQSIIKDKYGFMWFGTFNGLCRYDGYKFKTYNSIPGDTTSIANNRVHYIYKDKNGVLWIATFDSYVCRYNYQTDNFTRYRLEKLPRWLRDSTNRLRNVANFQRSAKQLDKWVGKFNLGPTKEHVVFKGDNNQTSLDDNNAYCVYQDNAGLVWIGTSTGGINKGDVLAKPFRNFSFSAKNELSSSISVRAMEADGTGGLWLGTLDTGLIYSNPVTGIKKRFNRAPLPNTVRSICKDSFGDIWIGYRNGLDRYNPASNKFFNYFNENANPTSSENRFFSIAENPADHSMWFGTYNRILRYDRASKKFENQPFGSYFNRSNAMCLFFDSRMNLWIGTEYNGLIELKCNLQHTAWADTITFKANGQPPILPDNRIYTISEDEYHDIWAGTASGLVCIKHSSGAVKVYTRKEGLADQYISKILPDKNGSIWVSHKKGLSKVNIKTGVVSNYDMPDNLRGYQFLDCSGCVNSTNGTLNFGATEGYCSFDPKQIHENPFPPVVVLTELQILNSTVNTGQKINGRTVLSAPLYLTKNISLTQEDRSFSIEFAALHYSNPEKNQYAYMLDGVDKDWIYTDASRRFAAYSNLHEGRYTFKVKASNCDGLWNPVPATLEITILPPWWRTWWAYTGYLILVVFALYGIYKIVATRQQYHRDILIEKLKAEKAKELDELKSRFFTNISHEFRTPLSLIIDPLENLLAGKLQQSQLQQYYRVMHRNSRRLLGLINQFLDIRKLESGTLRLHVKKQDIIGFIRNVMGAFELLTQKRGLHFSFDTELKYREMGFDPDVLDKILYNLISNAFRFADTSVAVSLSAAQDSNAVILTITDDGPGFTAEIGQKIFEPFYQADDESRNVGGTGVGLSLTRELITLHGGTITASSEPGVRTCFIVILPDLAEEKTPPAPGDERMPLIENSNTAKEIDDITATADVVSENNVILVVEDNDDIRAYLKLHLSDHYTVIEAKDGNEGFEKATEAVPDLMISDVMMPGLNGIGLCQLVKTDERTSHIPVILLTARQSTEYQIEAYETGADAYVTKPFSMALLLVRVQNLLESRKRLRRLFDRSTGFNTRLITTNATDQAFLSKLTALIENHMAEESFSVEWIADQLFLSRVQLYRKIKSLTDRTVHDFITAIRLNKAAEMLLEGSHTVSEIAYLVGYSDPTNFSRNFQKQFGQTPKKYGRTESSS